MTADIVFSIIYLLIVVSIIYPPTEFVSAGLTIPAVFSSILGNEFEDFITYHIKRTTLTLFVYSVLPMGYVLGLSAFGELNGVKLLFSSDNIAFKILYTVVLALPVLAFVQIWKYGLDWANHPIVLAMEKFSQNSDTVAVASEINNEYRRIDKISIQSNPITTIVATENWVMKTTPLALFIARQDEAEFVVEDSDTHSVSHVNPGVAQFVTINVKTRRADGFKIRLNAMDFKDFQDRIARVITILPEVKFHKNVIDKFVDAFKEAVKFNASYKTEQELENCIGCMQNLANVKLQKLCTDDDNTNRCSNCSCNPMWCIDCMGRWFAHRQDMDKVNHWLSEKCTCPMCRATFCVLDISIVEDA